MANEILIIGVGSAGVIAADKMNLPNSKKLFVDADYRQLETVKSEGEKMLLQCKDFGKILVNAQAFVIATPNQAFARKLQKITKKR